MAEKIEIIQSVSRTARFDKTTVVFEEGDGSNRGDRLVMRQEGDYPETIEFWGEDIALFQEALKRVLPAQGGLILHPATNSQGQALR